MKKTLLGVFVGALVYFVWGMVSWMVLPWHSHTMKDLPEEQLISDTLKTVVSEPGYYAFPSDKNPDGKKDMALWSEKYRKGPVGAIVFSPAGKEPMGAVNFIVGIVGDFIIAIVGMMLLLLTRDRVTSVFPRALLVMSVGLVVAVAVHLPYWNWMNFPLDFTLVSMADSLVSFLLMGFAQSAFLPRS